MPFNSSSGFEFSATGIAGYAPIVSGVYGIYNGSQWIYIDEARDIRLHLCSHFCGKSDQGSRIMACQPTYFIFEKCDPQSGATRKEELIREHRPLCNLAPE
jgi:hypothetical protein